MNGTEKNSTIKLTFKKIIQLTSQELFKVIHSTSDDSAELHYARCVYAYLTADIKSLSRLILQFESFQSLRARAYQDIARLRMQVRKNEVQQVSIERIKSHCGLSVALDGEIFFVCGQANERLEKEKKVYEYYCLSYEAFKSAGLLKKAVLAAMNMVACKDRMQPSSILMPEYFNIIAMAKEAKAYSPQGTALLNVAREFSLAKSYVAALKYCNEAVDLLREHMYGSYQYHFALCNRCEIYCKLGDAKAALADYEEASLSEIPEIKGALSVLVNKISKARKSSLKGRRRSVSTWRNRLDGVDVRFTKMEIKLIEILEAGTLRFEDLSERLYEEKAADETKSNRVRQLIFRLRKKIPQCIKHENGMVSLSQSIG
ncbi:helix-turn-helix domain-containing protein [Oligoflexaceae bacterium]|nr:helix-turn-helix domain-containing protein [Oligoflexaceae bacterium]